jgi:hypothetical protein
LFGSGSPLELANAEGARALGHALGKGDFIAFHGLGHDHATVIAALDDGAAEEIGNGNAAVQRREHGRCAGWRAALAPGILAGAIFIGELDVATGQRVEHDLHGHQLHHAGGRAQLVGILLEQYGAGTCLDQDRGRRVRIVAALLDHLLGALHALIGGMGHRLQRKGGRQQAGHKLAQKRGFQCEEARCHAVSRMIRS